MTSITSLQDRLFQKYLERALRQLPDTKRIIEGQLRLNESSQRWRDAVEIIQAELPKRGWYLTGQETSLLTPRLARLAKEENWTEIDRILVEQATGLVIDVAALAEWLKQHNVPDCCVERIRIFLKARDDGSHEISTLVGVPLIDELCRALYGGRDFTSKRSGRQPKPQMACNTNATTNRLTHYCEGFVRSFGLIHEDVDPSKLDDEDYFNRSAIVHGMMRRSYGPKDSAKAFMALMFLVFATNEENENTD